MATEGEADELSSRRNIYPKDFLRRFTGEVTGEKTADVAGADTGEVELSLGLSLGGCFGAEPKRLARASSISTLSMFSVERSEALTRTWSMPLESEEEGRKRREMQSLKRMEAKRKRSEKRAAVTKDLKEEDFDEDFVKVNGFVAPAELPRWPPRPASQGSVGSQGSSSSVVSDFGRIVNPMQGTSGSGSKNCVDLQTSIKPANPSAGGEENPSKKRSCTVNDGVKEMERSMMEEMPCVSTKGDGPNGRRVEGFLYRYRKGEEVRIVCVCHGTFLTPAEFVKHAGGGDVVHPLRHIVVNPAPSAFL
ncbi:ninja-family protein AFP3-like [Asparagus officinalis]|uniref:ninja-family protein AFP3-like n=1 Tax=Asparagus officinalis TaxID=4686 RepID=UPI00098E747A|nr:ninja-family protein AFP3-like [Asparagus officinalis]